MDGAKQGANVTGNSIQIKCSITGLIFALAVSLSFGAGPESKSPDSLRAAVANDWPHNIKTAASKNVKIAQAEKEGLPARDTADQPIEITSKKVVAKKTTNGQEIVFEGSVQAKQGNVILTCDRLIVIYDQKKGSDLPDGNKKNPKDLKESGVFKSATALGNVKVVQNETKAIAGKAVFDSIKKTITLTESPKIWRGQDWGTASVITIFINENQVETEGDNKFVINPQRM
jgi:lipopolysaccharide transport protein LptA